MTELQNYIQVLSKRYTYRHATPEMCTWLEYLADKFHILSTGLPLYYNAKDISKPVWTIKTYNTIPILKRCESTLPVRMRGRSKAIVRFITKIYCNSLFSQFLELFSNMEELESSKRITKTDMLNIPTQWKSWVNAEAVTRFIEFYEEKHEKQKKKV